VKILVIGVNYAPEPVGIGPYTAGLAETLAAAGHAVEAIVAEPYYPDWERATGTVPTHGQRTVERRVGVIRCRTYIPQRPTGRRRILHAGSFGLSALPHAIRAAMRLRPDIVFAVAPSLLSLPTAWIAARLSGAKLWIHVQDFEVDAACATALIAPDSALIRAARWLERRLLAMADRVSTISPQMLAKLGSLGLPSNRTYQLRNWANSGFAPDPVEAGRYRDEWGLGDRKVALYSGSIANKQGIEIIVEAARCLSARDDIAFVICGNGPNRERLAMVAAGMPNVQIHDLQPSVRMGGLLALAHVHLLPQIAGAADLVLPSKLSNMLSSGRPVITTAVPGTGLAIEVEGCGIVTPPGNAVALAQAVAALADDPGMADRLGRCGTVRACERWSQGEILARLEIEFEHILLEGQPVAEPAVIPARRSELPIK